MRAAHIGDIEQIPVPDQNGLVWTPVRHANAPGLPDRPLDEALGGHAQADPELASIRDDPRFPGSRR